MSEMLIRFNELSGNEMIFPFILLIMLKDGIIEKRPCTLKPMKMPGLYFKYILRKRVVTNIYKIANLKRHSLVLCSKLNDINNASM